MGILAGAYIGFGILLATVVTFDMAPRFGIGFTNFMAGTAFTVGLMLVVIPGAELFTGNNLMVVSAFTKEITFNAMLGRWRSSTRPILWVRSSWRYSFTLPAFGRSEMELWGKPR